MEEPPQGRPFSFDVTGNGLDTFELSFGDNPGWIALDNYRRQISEREAFASKIGELERAIPPLTDRPQVR